MKLKDNINFTDKEQFPALFRVFGWNVRDFNTFEDMAVIRADFYPIGHVLGFSNKAIIMCDGEMQIVYDNKTFTDFQHMIELYGDKAYETFPEWEIIMEKQWAIKKDGEWIAAFTNLAEMPYSKQVKC
jgi:predicted metal-dependent RNase